MLASNYRDLPASTAQALGFKAYVTTCPAYLHQATELEVSLRQKLKPSVYDRRALWKGQEGCEMVEVRVGL